MGNILQRIRQIAEREGVNITALEREIGASKGVISRALSKGTDIQSKWIQNVVENYPLYNVEWIVTGKGSMLKSDNQSAGDEIVRELEREIIELQREVIKLQKENAKLKEYKSIQPLPDRSDADELKKPATSRIEVSTKKRQNI